MDDVDQKRLFQSLLPWIVAAVAAAGVYVETLPLKSQRPSDEERTKFRHVGRQDVEARLWQDPFSAPSIAAEQTPEKRCDAAIKDRGHHLETLSTAIDYAKSYLGYQVRLQSVMVPGGPYFEDGELRRRYRYAVVTALLNSGWKPLDGDKLGYVWTFESCIENPWLRRAPELLIYEWFLKEPSTRAEENTAQREALLVLWLGEDAMSRWPLKGMERVLGLIGDPAAIRSDPSTSRCKLGTLPVPHAEKLRDRILAGEIGPKQSGGDSVRPVRVAEEIATKRTDCDLPWVQARVIGPSTTDALNGLVQDLALAAYGEWNPGTSAHALKFYSSGATGEITDESLQRASSEAALRCKLLAEQKSPGCTATKAGALRHVEMKKALGERLVRLTATDEKLASELLLELERRLTDPNPFWRIGSNAGQRLCDTTIAIVSEQNSDYTRQFRDLFSKSSNGCTPKISNFGYLRGIDGILPNGQGEPRTHDTRRASALPVTAETLLGATGFDRSEGRTQYDYISRLAQQLIELDASEQREGRDGIRAIGILGNDVYDKLVVLDSLRPRFPRAVFFAADLDARLIGGKAAASTRNLIVASAYGLTLHPDLQRRSPPFRDTYQTGMYFTALVATTDQLVPQRLFAQPRTFEIGRTQAIALEARGPLGNCILDGLESCASIHPPDSAAAETPWPRASVVMVITVALLALAALLFLASPRLRIGVTAAWSGLGRANARAAIGWSALAFIVLAFGAGAWWHIWEDATSGQGEPLAWLEGVSIWPTEILRIAALVGIVMMLCVGRWLLRRNVDSIADDFRLRPTLTERESRPGPAAKQSLRERIRWLWWFDSDPNSSDKLWERYVDGMRFGPSAMRITIASALFLIATVAVLSMDWPYSPHRGSFAAWVNHGMLIVVAGSLIGLLFAALDSSLIAARLLDHIVPATRRHSTAFWAPADSYWKHYPLGAQYIRPLVTFHFATRLASAVNSFVYLPFLAFLLILPARSRFFDAWDFALAYLAVVVAAVLLAFLAADRLRRAASNLRIRVLVELDKQAEKDRNAAALGVSGDEPSPESAADYRANEEERKKVSISGMRDSANPAYLFWEEQAGRIGRVPAQVRAEFVRGITEEIRATKIGPFRSFWEEPIVRAVLLLIGGSGTISLVEFFFFKGPLD